MYFKPLFLLWQPKKTKKKKHHAHARVANIGMNVIFYISICFAYDYKYCFHKLYDMNIVNVTLIIYHIKYICI